MLLLQLKTLLPFFMLQLLLNVLLISVAFYFLCSKYVSLKFNWVVPVVLGGTISLLNFFNQIIEPQQALSLATIQVETQQKTAAPTTAEKQDILQLKAAFIGAVDTISNSSEPITSELKMHFTRNFSELLDQVTTRREHIGQMILAYSCQKYFLEDALASIKLRKQVKSKETLDCEAVSGQYFNREKLIPKHVVENNNRTLAGLAELSGPTPGVPSAEDLKKELDAQNRRLERIQKLFE